MMVYCSIPYPLSPLRLKQQCDIPEHYKEFKGSHPKVDVMSFLGIKVREREGETERENMLFCERVQLLY